MAVLHSHNHGFSFALTGDEGLHGVFCNDGAFMLPLKRRFIQHHIILVQYSLHFDLEVEFSLRRKYFDYHFEGQMQAYAYTHVTTVLTTSTFQSTLKKLKGHISDVFALQFHFTYNTSAPIIIHMDDSHNWAADYMMIGVIGNVSGSCWNTSLTLVLKTDSNISTSTCDKMVDVYVSNINNIILHVMPSEVVSLIVFKLKNSLYETVTEYRKQNNSSFSPTYLFMFLSGKVDILFPPMYLIL